MAESSNTYEETVEALKRETRLMECFTFQKIGAESSPAGHDIPFIVTTSTAETKAESTRRVLMTGDKDVII